MFHLRIFNLWKYSSYLLCGIYIAFCESLFSVYIFICKNLWKYNPHKNIAVISRVLRKLCGINCQPWLSTLYRVAIGTGCTAYNMGSCLEDILKPLPTLLQPLHTQPQWFNGRRSSWRNGKFGVCFCCYDDIDYKLIFLYLFIECLVKLGIYPFKNKYSQIFFFQFFVRFWCQEKSQVLPITLVNFTAAS